MIKSHKWIKQNSPSYYYYFNNNKTSLSAFQENRGAEFDNNKLSIDEESSNGFLKVERDKFQSKSLKLMNRKKSCKINKDNKKKLTLSSISLPLYSCDDGAVDTDPVLAELKNNTSKNVQVNNLHNEILDLKSESKQEVYMKLKFFFI